MYVHIVLHSNPESHETAAVPDNAVADPPIADTSLLDNSNVDAITAGEFITPRPGSLVFMMWESLHPPHLSSSPRLCPGIERCPR